MEHNRISSLARKGTLRVVGLMSGTSVDGVDAAAVDISRRGAAVLAFQTFPFPPALRRAIFELFDPATAAVDKICHMNFVLGEVFAQAVIDLCGRARIPLASVDLVGSHGQTIYHIPTPRPWVAGRGVSRSSATRSTLQIGEPSVIAERTGIVTVADFRPRDIAAGGEGAPLVPYADVVLFGHKKLSRALQNIGGIANVTYLPAGCGVDAAATATRGQDARDTVLAFDTGPGNMIIDRLAWHATGGRLAFDRDGRLALAGRVHEPLLKRLMRHPFLRRRPPKSTGREMFGVQFADDLQLQAKAMGLSPADGVATATAFTAATIARAYRLLPGSLDEVIVCGGGARNPALMAMLRQHVAAEIGASVKVGVMDDYGIDADAKEAVSFAILAAETIRGRPSNVPAATGARRPVVLGKIVF